MTPGVDSANKEVKSDRGGADSGQDLGEFSQTQGLETTEARASSSSPPTPRRTRQLKGTPRRTRQLKWEPPADDPPTNVDAMRFRKRQGTSEATDIAEPELTISAGGIRAPADITKRIDESLRQPPQPSEASAQPRTMQNYYLYQMIK